ncbi:MAG: hypothetical protein NVS9B14_19100 [Candidatus Acidiferrum sp.]
MLKPEYKVVLQKLRDKTLEGRVPWKTAGKNRFECELDGTYAFVTWRQEDRYGVTMTESQSENDIFVVEAEEQIIYRQDEQREMYYLLSELFELARESALDVPGKLATVTNLLDKI